MQFKDLLYNPDEEVFIFSTKSQTQQTAMRAIGRRLSPKELEYLREKTYTEIENLMIKIDSTGIEKIKPKNRKIELQNDPIDEGTFLVEWKSKDKDGNIITKHYASDETKKVKKSYEKKGS